MVGEEVAVGPGATLAPSPHGVSETSRVIFNDSPITESAKGPRRTDVGRQTQWFGYFVIARLHGVSARSKRRLLGKRVFCSTGENLNAARGSIERNKILGTEFLLFQYYGFRMITSSDAYMHCSVLFNPIVNNHVS